MILRSLRISEDEGQDLDYSAGKRTFLNSTTRSGLFDQAASPVREVEERREIEAASLTQSDFTISKPDAAAPAMTVASIASGPAADFQYPQEARPATGAEAPRNVVWLSAPDEAAANAAPTAFSAEGHYASGAPAGSANITINPSYESGSSSNLYACALTNVADAEKCYIGDTELCWAATTSNMLYWAGWTATITIPGFTINSSQDLFSYFTYCFTDVAGNPDFGMKWFMNGTYEKTGAASCAQIKNSGGNFYPGLNVSAYLSWNLNGATTLSFLGSALSKGKVCGLLIDWEGGGGHAVTCWGYSYDSNKSSSSKAYYTGVWITDSDDNTAGARYCPVEWIASAGQYKLHYNESATAMISEVTALSARYTSSVRTTASGESIRGGRQTVYNGGIATSNTVGISGSQVVSSGGTTSNTTVSSGGSQTVCANGIASSTTVLSGGLQKVSSGGVASAANISGGTQTLYRAGRSYDATVLSGGVQNVSSGGIASSTTLVNGSQTVFKGGTASATTASSGGIQAVSSGGKTYLAVIESAGVQNVSSGGSALTTIVNSNGMQNVFSGGVASGAWLTGGSQAVSGGRDYAATIGSGGEQRIYNGGIASGAGIESAASQTIHSGGSAYATTVYYGGLQAVSSGGVTSSATINSGGEQKIYNGGQDYAATAYGLQTIYGGVAYGTTVRGTQNVSSGGVASSATVSSGGMENVYSSGLANRTSIVSGGSQSVLSGGSALSTNVRFGAVMTVAAGGTGSRTTVHSGGTMNVAGSATATTIYTWGLQTVSSGGSAIDTIVSGGSQHVSSGATVGGELLVAYGGKATVQNASSLSASMRLAFEVDGRLAAGTEMLYVQNGTMLANSTYYLYLTSEAATETYTLIKGANLSNLANVTFTVSNSNAIGTRSTSLNVGAATYVFANGNEVALSIAGGGTTLVANYVKTVAGDRFDNATALTLSPSVTATKNGSVSGDLRNYYTFTATSAGLFTISISNGLGINAVLRLYNSAERQLSQVSLRNGTATINSKLLTAGAYYAVVAANNGGTDYTLSIAGSYFPAPSGHGTKALAQDLGTLVASGAHTVTTGSAVTTLTSSDWVGYGDPTHYYEFTASNAGRFNISISGTEGAYAKLKLYSTTGSGALNLLKSVTMSGGGGSYSAAISSRLLQEGTYYVSVSSTDGGAGRANTSYTLNVGGEYFPLPGGNQTAATAQSVVSGGTVDDWIGYGDALDYFKYANADTSPTQVLLETSGAGAKLLVYSSTNGGATLRSVATYTLSGAGTLSKTLSQLSAGDYYFGIKSLDNGATSTYNTGYQLTVSSLT